MKRPRLDPSLVLVLLAAVTIASIGAPAALLLLVAFAVFDLATTSLAREEGRIPVRGRAPVPDGPQAWAGRVREV